MSSVVADRLRSINAALAERDEWLRADSARPWVPGVSQRTILAIKAQIRDLETEKHALLQELPL